MRFCNRLLSIVALTSVVTAASAGTVNLLNAGFENDWSSYNYYGNDNLIAAFERPTGPNMGWAFGENTAVVMDGSPVNAPFDGFQSARYAGLFGATGWLSQQFSLASRATAELSFFMKYRLFLPSTQVVEIAVDGRSVGTINATMGEWSEQTVDLGLLSVGNHTLAFRGLDGNPAHLGATAFLDAVTITSDGTTAVPEPGSLALVLLGLGSIGAAGRRRLNVPRPRQQKCCTATA